MSQTPEADIDFERLFDQSSSMIYNLGLRLFRNEEDALDFAQDVFLRAYDRRASFRGESRPSTWLYSLAMHLGLNRLKRNRRWRFEEQAPAIEELADSAQDEPLAAVTRAELEGIIREELGELDDVYRIPLVLYYYEQMPYKEIADLVGIKEGTLKSYLHRGKIILREKLLRREAGPT